MWELDCEKGRAPKTWCLQIALLEKALESPLDCKIQPVHPKGNQPLYSLEGLMLKLKLQYFGHLMQRTDSLEKTLMLGRIEGRRWGQQRLKWFDGIMTQWTWTWANSGRWWRTGKPGVLQSTGSQNGTWLGNWTTRRRSSGPLGTMPLCVPTFHWHTPSLTSLRCQAPSQLCDFAGATHLPGHFSYPRLESWTNVTCGLPSNSDYLWIWLWDFQSFSYGECVMPVCVEPGLSQHVLHTDTGMVHFLNTLNPPHLLHLLLSSECRGLPQQLSCKKSSDLLFSAKPLGMMGEQPLISSLVAGQHSSSHQLLSLSEWTSP